MRGLMIFFLLFGTFVSSVADAEEPVSLKVLSWNIWHGGHVKAYGEKACGGTQGILKKSGADVILMIETYGSSKSVAKALGYDYRLISSNLSIYSRYPILKTYTFPKMIPTFNFGGVELDVKGRRVRVFDTWLHYLPDTRLVPTTKSAEEIKAWENAGSRDDEIRAILKVLQPMIAEADKVPIIVGGDFNSHSHLDWTEATKDLYRHGGAVVDWTVSKTMVDAGFVDSFRQLNPDPVKHLGVTWYWTGKKKDREDRIDYIYYKGAPLRAVESEVYNGDRFGTLKFFGEDFFYASDHGFVLTTFQLK